MRRTALTGLLVLVVTASLAAQERTKRILIVGDSWAVSITAENRDQFPVADVFDDVLAANGLGAFQTQGAVTAWSGRKASDWAQPDRLAEIVQELVAHPNIDIVHLIIGGNDFLKSAQQEGFRQKNTEARSAVWDGIKENIQQIVDTCLGVRKEIRVVIAGYDYLDHEAAESLWKHMDFQGATTTELNTWFTELGQRKRSIALETPRCEYLNNWGTLQYWFGNPPKSVPLPGGDVHAPMPPGISPDGIHPNAEAHAKLLQNAVDTYYAAWLGSEPKGQDASIAALPRQRGRADVSAFGARGDGVTDDTQAFQQALDAVASEGGGLVTAPAGRFLIASHLNIPDHVTLEGVWRSPQKWAGEQSGTMLLAVEGKGNPDGAPFITLNTGSTLSGLTIFYPEQVRANPPHAYPWTVATRKFCDNPSIVNVTMINPYQAVDFGSHPTGRHYINGLYAHPLLKGLYINQCYDVGRIENIHFWPFWDQDPKSPLWVFTRTKGTAFIIGKTDGQMAFNLFSIFYSVGMHFLRGDIRAKDGTVQRTAPGSGVYTNCYMDITPCAVKVDDVASGSGISFVNGMFMSGIEVAPTNKGPVKFSACGFWPNQGQTYHAQLAGRGTLFFQSCHFSGWDQGKTGVACLDVDSRRVIITGCDFSSERQDHVQVRLGPSVQAAVVTSNLMGRKVRIVNETSESADIQVGFNASD